MTKSLGIAMLLVIVATVAALVSGCGGGGNTPATLKAMMGADEATQIHQGDTIYFALDGVAVPVQITGSGYSAIWKTGDYTGKFNAAAAAACPLTVETLDGKGRTTIASILAGELAFYDANSGPGIRPPTTRTDVNGRVEVAPKGVDILSFNCAGWDFTVVVGSASQGTSSTWPDNRWIAEAVGTLTLRGVDPDGAVYQGSIPVDPRT